MATRFFSIVIDAGDIAAASAWWSDALRWPVVYAADDEVVVAPDPAGEFPALVFVPVPEPKSGKNRVHLDLASSSVDDQRRTVERLVGLGAQRADIGQHEVPWVVMQDPEGNEFCVLEPRQRYLDTGPLAAVVLDAIDPPALARFWAEATGWDIAAMRDEVATLHAPGGAPPDLDLVRVLDAKRGKNRIHLDVAPALDDDRDTEVARLVGHGARRIDVGQGENVTWEVLADPEGNEFCVLRPR